MRGVVPNQQSAAYPSTAGAMGSTGLVEKSDSAYPRISRVGRYSLESVFRPYVYGASLADRAAARFAPTLDHPVK